MAFKKYEEPNKGELTSMIDMIFLLLIFFLVTLSTDNGGGSQGEIPLGMLQRGITNPKCAIPKGVDKIIMVVDGNSNLVYVISPATASDYAAGTLKPIGLSQITTYIHPGERVGIGASEFTPYGRIVEIYDVLTGLQNPVSWGIVTKPTLVEMKNEWIEVAL